MGFGDRSSFRFRRVSIFDAVFTLRLAAVLLVTSLAFLYRLGPTWGVPVVVLVVAGSALLARLDRRRPTCLSVRLDDVVVEDPRLRGGFLMADVYADRSSVAKLRRQLSRFDHIHLPPTRKKMPLACVLPGWRTRWFSEDAVLDLAADEVRGALSVVLRGSDVSIEVLVGSLPGRPSGPLAVRVESSEGAIESWDPLLRPTDTRFRSSAEHPVGVRV